MTSNPIFRGVATALVTPTTADGVDYEALGRLIDWQIEEGINALVIAGTTGEGSTLSVEEHKEVIRFSVQRVNHRIPVIGGTGSNDTATAIELTKSACEDGGLGHHQYVFPWPFLECHVYEPYILLSLASCSQHNVWESHQYCPKRLSIVCPFYD